MPINKPALKRPVKPREKKAESSESPESRPRPAVVPRSLGRRMVTYLLYLALVGLIAAGVGGFMVYSYVAQDLPPVDALKHYRPKTVTFIYSDDGRTIGEYSRERRIVVPLAKIPDHVRRAFIAAEDANFYSHPGIDFLSIIRAAIKNVEAGHIVQGASTITMQVTRSFLLSPEKTFSRKIKEAVLAFRIDSSLTKDEVLYLYLNQIYLGHGAYGVESASQLYFDKHVNQLSMAEAALLAGLPQAPSRYSPFNHPEEARRRQLYALGRLVENGYITKEQAEAAKTEKLQFRERPNLALTQTPYFTEHVRRMLEEKFGEDRLYTDGFKVYTTVNIECQVAADKAVEKGLLEFSRRREYHGPAKKLTTEQVEPFLKKQEPDLADEPLVKGRVIDAVVSAIDPKSGAVKVRVGRHQGTVPKKETAWVLTRGQPIQKILSPGDVILVQALEPNQEAGGWLFSLEQHPQVQSALLSLDLRDGAAKAMVGGRDFKESQFNRAVQSRRQPGSAFKPIIYTAAMDNGYTPGSIIIDAPFVYDDLGSRQRWKPTNFDHKFYGPTDLYTGLVQSRNVMAVKLLHRVGFKPVVQTARQLGITSALPESLSMALGANGVSLPEMVTAFSAFPNMGERVEPRYILRIEDRDGQLVEESRPVRIKAISSGTACVLTHMLMGVVNQGTGTRVRTVGRPCGGKTGTTNDLADAWFIGFTPEYVTGVWVGLDEMKPMGVGESGGRAAAPIFAYYMESVLKGKPVRDFPVPPDATLVNNGSAAICYKAGTVGTGLSEAPSAGGEDFLKSDFDDKEL